LSSSCRPASPWETGFTRAKNVVNIMMKNLMDFSIGSLAFFFVGFG
jgi:Amt family ammonium transporter